MKKLLLIFTLVLFAALVACGGQEPTPTPLPTEAPPTEVPPTAVPPTPTDIPPTEVPPTATIEPTPESPLASMEHTPDPQLIDLTWEWQQRAPAAGQGELITVPNPENYTLTFNADGTFNAQLDCNGASGQYATDAGNIYMELGPMTLMACEPDSLSDQMMMTFGQPQTYRFEQEGNILVLSWEDGTEDYFVNAATTEPGEAEIEAIPADAIQLDLQGLADSFDWVVQPVSPVMEGPGNQGMPPHILLTFDGETPEEAVANNGRRLYIFPTQAYIDLYLAADNSLVADQVTRLQDLIAQAEGRTEPPTENMPVLPPPTSFMDRWVQFSDLDFGAGSGVRYVSDSPYRLDAGPWTNDMMNYYFQGLTSNGVYYVSLIWPVSTESLPDTGADVPEDVMAQATTPDTLPDYLESTKETLNALETADWTPDLASLDALVQSLDFPAEGAPSLTGTTWQWVSTTTPVEETAVSDPTRYTITFNDDGTAAIKADCNNVAATYTTDSSSLTIIPGPTTLAACPEDSQGDQFVSSLSNAAIYFFQDGDLYMDMKLDSGTLRFTAQTGAASGEATQTPSETPEAGSPVSSATGIEFQVVSFGPAGTEQPVLEGTTITATFGENEVTGSAGCNTYSGPMNPVNDYFTVGPIITTRMACDEAVMQQEQAYLAALESLTGYQWASDLADNTSVVTAGQLFYTLDDGTNGVINLLVP